jgi:3-oxoacyl-[acyl-carrier protein] reductase
MRDRYRDLVNRGPGSSLAAMLGLPRPAKLRRYAVGEPLLAGPAIVEGVAGAPLLAEIHRILTSAGVDIVTAEPDSSQGPGSALGPGLAHSLGPSWSTSARLAR